MFNSEIRKLLLQVVTSWQVWVVTAVLVIYVFIVNHVARIYHSRRPHGPMIPKFKKLKPGKTREPEGVNASESDELGLEEEIIEK